MPFLRTISNAVLNAYILSWDVLLTLLNTVTPSRPVGHVIPEGHPGYGGQWPEYIAPTEGDSRCSCPALNAMANHGILPRDGKNISFTALNKAIRATYNFAPTFCLFVPNFSSTFLGKSYSKGTFDLKDLDLHNIGIEHDASLTREDVALVPDQSHPSLDLVEGLLATASGKNKEGEVILTPADLSYYSAKRRVDARRTNPEYQLDFGHKMFGSSNSSTMLTIFGGRISDLRPWLTEERLPEGWEPRVRRRYGLTMGTFNLTVLPVEFSIKEKKILQEEAEQVTTKADSEDDLLGEPATGTSAV
ncbi:hypothetical protein PLICRDRAFT_105120 [Plicaturopsis crispa FD-325 SS-3]|nr:hypothetical protein PLICRDRAFT_105120 [Plicaturopsis crispa FD-325 SS-3]